MRPKKPETTGEGDLFRVMLDQIILYPLLSWSFSVIRMFSMRCGLAWKVTKLSRLCAATQGG